MDALASELGGQSQTVLDARLVLQYRPLGPPRKISAGLVVTIEIQFAHSRCTDCVNLSRFEPLAFN